MKWGRKRSREALSNLRGSLRSRDGYLRSSIGTLLMLSLGLVFALPVWGQANPRTISITADAQEANANTGVFTATGNVTLRFPAERLTARAQRAVYYSREQRIELEGQVTITQGDNQLQAEKVIYDIDQGTIQAVPVAGGQVESIYVLPEPEPASDPSPAPESGSSSRT